MKWQRILIITLSLVLFYTSEIWTNQQKTKQSPWLDTKWENVYFKDLRNWSFKVK